jgi:hypothetical protein
VSAEAAAAAQHGQGSAQHSAAQQALQELRATVQAEVKAQQRVNTSKRLAAQGMSEWTPEEDAAVHRFVEQHGTAFRQLEHVEVLARVLPGRSQGAVRARWVEYLGPGAEEARAGRLEARRANRAGTNMVRTAALGASW